MQVLYIIFLRKRKGSDGPEEEENTSIEYVSVFILFYLIRCFVFVSKILPRSLSTIRVIIY